MDDHPLAIDIGDLEVAHLCPSQGPSRKASSAWCDASGLRPNQSAAPSLAVPGWSGNAVDAGKWDVIRWSNRRKLTSRSERITADSDPTEIQITTGEESPTIRSEWIRKASRYLSELCRSFRFSDEVSHEKESFRDIQAPFDFRRQSGPIPSLRQEV
jgi:hypothetical protein